MFIHCLINDGQVCCHNFRDPVDRFLPGHTLDPFSDLKQKKKEINDENRLYDHRARHLPNSEGGQECEHIRADQY